MNRPANPFTGLRLRSAAAGALAAAALLSPLAAQIGGGEVGLSMSKASGGAVFYALDAIDIVDRDHGK